MNRPLLLPAASPWARIGLAVVVALAAGLVRVPLTPLLGNDYLFVTFFPAAALSALLLGFWPGVVCTLACLAIAEFWVADHGGTFPLNAADTTAAAIFLASGVFVSALGSQAARSRRIEGALEQSETRYRAIVESQADMICRFRMDGTILFVNGAYARSRGTTAAALQNANLWDFIVEADRAAVRSMLESLRPDAPVVRIENRFQTAAGTRWTLWTNHALSFDDSGRAVELQSTGVDITDRRAAEEERQQLSAQRQLALDAASMGWWNYDLVRGVISWDDRVAAIFGLDGNSGSLEHVLERICAEDRARVGTAVAAALDPVAPRPYRIEYRVTNSQGDIRWVETRGLASFEGEGAARKPLSLVGTAADITERMRAEQALHDKRQQLQLALDAADMGTWVYDFSTGIVSLGPAAQRLYGLESSEWLHNEEGVRGVLHDDDIPPMWEAVRAACDPAGDGRYRTDYRILLPDGGVRWLSAWGVTQFEGEGESRRPVRMVGASRDITPQREAEDALRRSNDELERFAYIASHDLKEPLRGISMITDFLVDDQGPAIDAEGRDRLQRIQQLCKRLLGMVEGLLDYARSGGDQLKQPCDLSETARRAVETLSEVLAARAATVHVHDPLPIVPGDPMLLERAIANLVANAVKYNDSPAPRVDVGWASGELFVRDNGIGIHHAHHARVFEVFRRVHPGRDSGGLGLGLAFVKKIAESHSGSVRLESEPGQGSTFYVRLPGAILPLQHEAVKVFSLPKVAAPVATDS